MNLVIFGAGYVGLTTGVCLAERGNNVICIDNNPEKIKKLKLGDPLIYEEGLEELLKRNLKNKNEKLKNKLKELSEHESEKQYKLTREAKTAKFVLDIIDNCFNVFEKLDLKYKKDLMNIFIESAYGNGDKVEINLLNTNIEESRKKVFYATYLGEHKKINSLLSTDSMGRQPN